MEGMTTAREVAERLGGQEVLREQIRTELQLATAIRRGLPAASADALLATGGLTAAELHTLVVSRRMLALRRRTGQPLTPSVSDRLARITRVLLTADEAFGDSDRSYRWLRKPNRALGGRVPLALLTTGPGARLVEDSLERIAHGVFA